MNEIQKSYLLETAKWQKFLGIVIAVCTVLIAVVGIVLIILGIRSDPGDVVISQNPPVFSGIGTIGGISYLLFAVVYFLFARYLLRSAKYLKAWGTSEAEEDLTEGLKNNKSYFKLSGIVTIVGIVLAVLLLIGTAIAGVAGVAGIAG